MSDALVVIRPECEADAAAITAVTRAAFGAAEHASDTEHLIIEGLRRAGQLTVSLVAEVEGTVVGHVAVSPVSISSGDRGWYGLGPLSVLPAAQRRGIGTRLVETALSHLRALGARGCVVVGEPAYYGRFGFAATADLEYPGLPAEYFHVCAFEPPVPTGVVRYHDAFDV
jgi:putative acetyltransferase